MKQSTVSMVYLVICIIIFITVFIVTPFAFADTNKSGSFLEGIKSFWYLFSPPKDYFKPLISDELDISKKGLIKTFEFKHKYKGNHDVGIFLNRFDKGNDFFAGPSHRYKLKLKMEINFYVKNSIVLSKVTDDYDALLSEDGGGLILVFYKTPKDLPVNETIKCELKIIEPDKYLNDTYGPAIFFVRKGNDK